MSSDAEQKAITMLANRCYHQCLWIPATEKHGKLRVTFATSSNFDNDDLPVMLFVPPQFCSRYHIVEMDHLAQAAGVRLLGADRYVACSVDTIQDSLHPLLTRYGWLITR